MKYRYETYGTCSRAIDLDIAADGTITSVAFTGGCNGNTQGICSLVRGLNAREAATRLRGIKCGSKQTSCPDQLAVALEEVLKTL